MFQSNVLWPKELRGVSMYVDSISTDTHSTERAAKCVCELIVEKGFGGNREVFPIYAWVSEVKEPPKLPADIKFISYAEWPDGDVTRGLHSTLEAAYKALDDIPKEIEGLPSPVKTWIRGMTAEEAEAEFDDAERDFKVSCLAMITMRSHVNECGTSLLITSCPVRRDTAVYVKVITVLKHWQSA